MYIKSYHSIVILPLLSLAGKSKRRWLTEVRKVGHGRWGRIENGVSRPMMGNEDEGG